MPAKPFEAASATEERLQLASAPSELVTPLTARAASSAAAARAIKVSGAGSTGIGEVEIGPAPRQLLLRGKAAIGILGHGMRHRDCAFDEFVDPRRIALVRRHGCLSLADEDTQAEIVALGALELLDPAEALRVRQRRALEQDGVGGIGAGAARAADQVAEKGEGVHGVILNET